eukprot:scaffold95020_cov72-Phaeocystis_antarctica.AAC.7
MVPCRSAAEAAPPVVAAAAAAAALAAALGPRAPPNEGSRARPNEGRARARPAVPPLVRRSAAQ